MELEVGKYYRTYGGWKAIVIWQVNKWTNTNHNVLVIHKPNTSEESHVVSHTSEGRAITLFSVNEPPVYGQHPADLKEEWGNIKY